MQSENRIDQGLIEMKRTRRNRGFTLVELLVVITIIAILIALLLPAVQMAREAARRAQCKNHVKQLALGCMTHESLFQRFPTGGWGFGWTGDADLGTDWRQPGGWQYVILPYIELGDLHDLGMGMGAWDNAAKLKANLQRVSTPISAFYCPSRRSPQAYPYGSTGGGCVNVTSKPTSVGRSDYAANGGDTCTCASTGGPGWSSYGGNGDAGPSAVSEVVDSSGNMTSKARSTFSGVAKVANGIVYCGSLIRAADITDGQSNTYLLGEKYANPDFYETGGDQGDNESALIGDNEDNTRWCIGVEADGTTIVPTPRQDYAGYSSRHLFGSPHAEGFNMGFCDGSVQFISYDIEATVHNHLGNRKDGEAIDARTLGL
jgi:prepilin-type N-terminal cleavage/methylation domain-containing protein/prepilin-type processing-associated H-X9-DG protein